MSTKLPYQSSEITFTERKSRFIGNVFTVYSEKEAREMIAMVRAICQQKNIILFDEATANLDLLTEQQLNRGLRQLLQQRTALLVAHRLSTMQMADRILVVEQGSIVEQGTPEQLYAQQGVYRKLVEMEESL